MPVKDKGFAGLPSVLVEVAEIMQNGLMWLNSDGKILGTNSPLIELLGYTNGNFQPQTIFEVNPTTSLLSWKKYWKKLLTEKQVDIETEQINANEQIFPVRMRGVLVYVEEMPLCVAIIENLMQSNRYEELLNLTTEVAGIGSWEWDLVHQAFLFTSEMYRMLQLPPNTELNDQLLQEIFQKLVSQEDQKLLTKNFEAAIKTGKGFEMEFSLNINGNYQTYNFNAHPIWHEEETIKIYGTLQNLAKVSQRTDDLYFTRFCMDQARDMIFWVDREENITYVNQTVCEVLGYTYEELLGKKVKDLSPESNMTPKAYWEHLKKEKSLEFESVQLTKDGQFIPVSVVSNYINFRDKEFICVFARNLSAKQYRDELIALAKRSLDQSVDMIFWLKKDGSFRYFNDALVKKTGYSATQLDKMSIYDLFPETDKARFLQGWESLKTNGAMTMERTLALANGKKMPTEMTVSIVSTHDREYSSTILRDITVQKKREAEREAYLTKIEQLQQATESENIQLKEEIELEFNFSHIISSDPNYKKVLHQVEQVADTDATVLVLGETGTGKELLARAIHQLSDRDEMPMIKVNCGALPENLIESELFGHEKGAFTGAYQRRLGKFERAHRGTIFLDEVGELPLDMQAKLLRVLQEGELERVGGSELLKVDVRVITATNRNLEELVEEGKFREDLFYRLNVFPIYNIPLRERRQDIPVLVKHFVNKYSKRLNKKINEISQSGMNKLMAYDFLGNVRELENIIERSIILSKSTTLDFEKNILQVSTKKSKSGRFKTMEEIQRIHIIKALQRANGKVSGQQGAAILLGMNDKTLTSRMKKLNIGRKDYL